MARKRKKKSEVRKAFEDANLLQLSLTSISAILIIIGFGWFAILGNTPSFASIPLWAILVGLGAIAFSGMPNIRNALNIIFESIPLLVVGIMIAIFVIQQQGVEQFRNTLLGWALGLFLLAPIAGQFVKRLVTNKEEKKTKRR